MRKTAHVERRFETDHRILDRIGALMEVGKQKPWSYPAVAEEIGEAAHSVLLAKRTFEDAGILRTTLEYPKGRSGRVSMWELTMPVAMAHEELRREHARQLERPSRKEVRRRRMDDGSASSLGHLRIPRLDESRALVADAKEYRHRVDWARQHIAEMRDAGIEIEEDAVTVRRDERLESIVLVLPVIEELERENDRLSEQAQRWQQEVMDSRVSASY